MHTDTLATTGATVMGKRPDYGIFLQSNGYSGVSHQFYHVPIDHITVIGEDEGFTTLVNKVVNGTEYAVSFDFSFELWESLRDSLPEQQYLEIDSALSEITELPYTIEFFRPALLNLAATLGSPKNGINESFVPLNVDKVSPG